MKAKAALIVAIATASLIGLSGCESEPIFTAETPKQFEEQYFAFMDTLSPAVRDQYELSFTTLVLYAEEQLSDAEIEQGEHLKELSRVIQGKTASDVIDMASAPQYEEQRERAIQLIMFQRDPEWDSNTSVKIENDAIGVDKENALELLENIEILSANVLVEDGARSYLITLQNNTKKAIQEIDLSLGLSTSGQQLDGQKLTYQFPETLASGHVHEIVLSLTRPGVNQVEDSPEWLDGARLSGKVISALAADGERVSRE